MTTGADSPLNADQLSCDVAIVGGGVAGLWLLNLLSQRGYNVLLFEAEALGNAQSIASQGMIHGGIKYALGAALTGASEAIARMPDRWRSCLQGKGDLDLSDVSVVAHKYHMWSDGKLGKLGSFFASHALRGRVDTLERADYPSVFQTPSFNGTVHALNDLVLDVKSLLSALTANYHDKIVAAKVTGAEFETSVEKASEIDKGRLRSLRLNSGQSVRANQFIFSAGSGNRVFADALREAGHSHAPATQLRPLHQVFVVHPDLQELHAHCITGIRRAEPRLTITTHALDPDQLGQSFSGQTRLGWYIGGHLATAGVKRTAEAQIEVTRKELAATLPWIDWSIASIETLRIDRAEPRQHLGTKPDEACVVRCGNAMLCWPTKLSLVPDLGDQVVNSIEPPQPSSIPYSAPTSHSRSDTASHTPSHTPSDGRVSVAQPPWLRF